MVLRSLDFVGLTAGFAVTSGECQPNVKHKARPQDPYRIEESSWQRNDRIANGGVVGRGGVNGLATSTSLLAAK